jgi:hypothetical protein
MDSRLEEINNLLVRYSLGEFEHSIQPSEKGDEIDAVINNINMLGEQLKTSVISRDHFNNIAHSVSDKLLVLDNEKGKPHINKPPFVTPYIILEIIDGILHGTYLPGAVITIDLAKEIVAQRLEYCEGVSYPGLATGEGLKGFDKDAREYLSIAGGQGVLAGALLVYSVYTKFLGDFFLKVHPAKIPSKIFTNRKEALSWLEQFKNQSERF